jgi:hypothetical protein
VTSLLVSFITDEPPPFSTMHARGDTQLMAWRARAGAVTTGGRDPAVITRHRRLIFPFPLLCSSTGELTTSPNSSSLQHLSPIQLASSFATTLHISLTPSPCLALPELAAPLSPPRTCLATEFTLPPSPSPGTANLRSLLASSS